MQGWDGDRPWREKPDQEKPAYQQVPLEPSRSSEARATEPPQAAGEGKDDGRAQADDREKKKDTGIRIAARQQEGRQEERAEHQHATHNRSLRVGPRSP